LNAASSLRGDDREWPQWRHEDRSLRHRLSAGCRLAQPTFAGTHSRGREAPFADLADKTSHLFKHTIDEVETPYLPVEEFLPHLGGGTLYSGDQASVVKRVAEAGCPVGDRMQSG
jgi:hypothetical protein